MIQTINTYPLELILPLSLILGLVVGSFLNVVIYRLPLQLQNSWRHDAMDFLGQEPPAESKKFSLVYPPSRCPSCETLIKPWHNIPIIGYLLLKGRCKSCAEPISLQYPAVELICGLLTLAVVYHFGFTAQAALAILFTWMLVALTGIDVNHQLLPDSLTLPLLWLGLLVNISGTFVALADAVAGAAAGYLILWSVYWAFKLITGKEGMGHGDFKLLAALGAWLGWQQLPMIILLSSAVGALIGTIGILLYGRERQAQIAFGPYLAIAGWIALVAGEEITKSYLQLL
ncbi:MAG: prepilin peptidase [Porticoccaceae bacterium]|nr:prepilin peptidase [Porticoccaceae bacterium]